MKNDDKIRAQFEERYPVPSGMRWEPDVGPAGDYILADVRCCSGDRAARYIARWEAWQESRKVLAVALPKAISTMAGPVMWAVDVRDAVEAQGLKVTE